MIQKNLDKEIYAKVAQSGTDCTLIIMHPNTWQDLYKEVLNSDSLAIYRHEPSLKYKGIRVLRSLDIVEGLFKVI